MPRPPTPPGSAATRAPCLPPIWQVSSDGEGHLLFPQLLHRDLQPRHVRPTDKGGRHDSCTHKAGTHKAGTCWHAPPTAQRPTRARGAPLVRTVQLSPHHHLTLALFRGLALHIRPPTPPRGSPPGGLSRRLMLPSPARSCCRRAGKGKGKDHDTFHTSHRCRGFRMGSGAIIMQLVGRPVGAGTGHAGVQCTAR